MPWDHFIPGLTPSRGSSSWDPPSCHLLLIPGPASLLVHFRVSLCSLAMAEPSGIGDSIPLDDPGLDIAAGEEFLQEVFQILLEEGVQKSTDVTQKVGTSEHSGGWGSTIPPYPILSPILNPNPIPVPAGV